MQGVAQEEPSHEPRQQNDLEIVLILHVVCVFPQDKNELLVPMLSNTNLFSFLYPEIKSKYYHISAHSIRVRF